MEEVILVDKDDTPVGAMEKMEVHRSGILHRAFSVMLYNGQGQVLLQKRAKGKYHSGGLWTNACCSHPRPGEDTKEAARRRLREEMGISVDLVFQYKFIYEARLDRNLVEHELDHVYTGRFDGQPAINRDEVEDWKYVDMTWLKEDVRSNPDLYTVWFQLIVDTLPLLNGATE